MSVLDTFTGVDETGLVAYSANWTKHTSWSSGAIDIRSNRANPGSSEALFYYTGSIDRTMTVFADVYVRSVAGYGGVAACVTGAQTAYVAYLYAPDGQWALGKYVAGTWTPLNTWNDTGITTGSARTCKIVLSSTQVKLVVDGVVRITSNDTSITPTRAAIYGGSSGSSTGVHIDNFGTENSPVAPTTGTLSGTGTLGGVTLGCNLFAMAVLGCTITAGDAPTSWIVEQSVDGGSTWGDYSAYSSWSLISGSNWKIVVRRPHVGAKAASWGGSAKYRVTPVNIGGSGSVSNTVTVTNLTPDRSAVILQRAANHSTFMAGSYVASQPGAYYPADTMVDMATGYLESVRVGSPVAQYKTDVLNQFAYIQTLNNADNLIQFPAFTTYFYLDHHVRTAYYALAAAMALDRAGAHSDYLTILAQVDTWAKAVIDKFGVRSFSLSGYQANSQTAWAAGATIAAGEIRRPTSANGRSYRALNAGTTHASTQPTWPTSTGGTVTDNGITWKETSYSGNDYRETYYKSGSVYNGADAGFTINQHLEVAAFYADLCTLPDSAFYTAGSYRTEALARIVDIVGFSMTMQTTAGAIPLGLYGGATYTTTLDTLYGGFCSQSMATILKRLGSQVTGDGVYVDRITNWLLGYYNAAEALTAVHKTSYDPESPQDPDGPFELLFPTNAAALRGISTGNVENIALSGAFWDEATGRWGDYSYDGAIKHTADDGLSMVDGPYPALSQNTLDSYGLYLAISWFSATAGDTWGWSDSPAKSINRSRAAADTWAWSDTAAQVPASSRTPADTWAWSDSTSRSLAHGYTRTPGDTWAWSDTVTGTLRSPTTVSRTTADTWAWTDHSNRSAPAAYQIALPATADFISARSQTADFISARSQTADFTAGPA